MQTASTYLKPASSTPTPTTSVTTMNNANTPALPKTRFNWIFPAEKFQLTPSMRDGASAEEELSIRQQSAVFIYELGSSLKLPHYCVNTAVVYMHRFFMLNSFEKLNRFRVCAACLFLACKVEEFPRPLREVVDNTSKILKRRKGDELSRELVTQYSEDIIYHENILLSSLGFSLMVDHPHSLIVKTIQALGGQIQSLPEKTPRELAQTAYYLATKSILLTSFCVKYPPDLIAGFCIHLAAAWLKIEMPNPASSESTPETADSSSGGGRRWFHLLNNTFTEKQLGELADEFLAIYEKCPEKIKKKLVYQNERSQANSQDSASTSSQSGSSRPTDLADSVVPQGSVKSDRPEQHRQVQPPLQASRPSQQPPLPPPSNHQPPPPPPQPTSHSHTTQSSSGAVRRDHLPPTGSTFSSNNRTSGPPSRPNSYPQQTHPPTQPQQQQQQQQHPSNHFQGQHHPHQGYHSHPRYGLQQQRPGTMPTHRSSQPPPNQGIPSQYNMDRKSQQPMPGAHSYDHSGNMGPPVSSSSGTRGPHGPLQRNPHHSNGPPAGKNPYPQPPVANMNHSHHPHASHPQSRMNMGGEKRNYESPYDPNHSKRARPS